MDVELEVLAEKLGIGTRFLDGSEVRQEHIVDEKIIKFFIEKMGYKANTEDEIKASISACEKRRWQQSLEKIYVTEEGKAEFDLVVPAEQEGEDFALHLSSNNNMVPEPVSFEVINDEEYQLIGKTQYVRLKFLITSKLEIGYYDLDLQVGNKHYKSMELGFCIAIIFGQK